MLNGPWRSDLLALAASARTAVLVAAPYIKDREANWFCDQIKAGVEVTTLANIASAAVGSSVLDLKALIRLAQASPAAKLVALPNLHAKVFVADDRQAIVTSGNLTSAGLQGNLEYGVLIQEPSLVHAVSCDMLGIAKLGSEIDAAAIARLLPLERRLREARASALDTASVDAKHHFDQTLREAKPAFAAVQVGDRSAHAVFGDAIRYVLAAGPRSTRVIAQQVSRLLPALCDDNEYFYVRGEPYGRSWKRTLRHAQQALTRKGIIAYDPGSRTWSIRQGAG